MTLIPVFAAGLSFPGAAAGGGGGGATAAWYEDAAYQIEGASFTDLGASDDFSAGTLDPQWSVFGSLAAGTVDLLGQASDVYDLTTRAGTLLFQPSTVGQQGIQVNAVPADGEQIVVALSAGGTELNANNSARIGLALHDAAGDPHIGQTDGFGAYYDGDDNGITVTTNSSGSVLSVVAMRAAESGVVGRRFYLRVVNLSGTYYVGFSADGAIWRPILKDAASGLAYTSIFVNGDGAPTFPPIMAAHWLRHTAYNGFDAF